MGEEIYYKTVIDLSAKEMMLIYDRHQDSQYPMPIPRFDKSGIVMNLASIQSDFLLNVEKKFVFRKTGTDLKYDPDYQGDCEQKKARTDHVLNIEKINELIELNNLNGILAEIKKESDKDSNKAQSSTGTTQTEQDHGTSDARANGPKAGSDQKPTPGPAPKSNSGQDQNEKFHRNHGTSSTSAPEPNSEKTITGNQFRMKTPKFDSQLPIENWICAMDIYKTCANLSEENIIKVSLTQLLTEDSGTSLIESISPDELKSWEAFKSKLIAVLGKDHEFFKHEYNTFKRGSESQAMALTKITAFFKKGYKKTALDEADEQIVCEKFIAAQEPRLMELLTREKSLLNLRNIAARATELERSFFNREKVFVAEQQNEKNSEIDQLCSKLEKMFTSATHQAQKNKKPDNKRKRIDTTKIQGYCISFVKNGKCKYGKKCRYIHSDDIPSDVQKLIKEEA